MMFSMSEVVTAVAEDELVGVAEISERTGMSRAAVSNAATRRASSGFPEPVSDLRMGPVYRWSEVEAWHEGRRA
jgi:predicted DNA-binding transcriptional regulator AlpA